MNLSPRNWQWSVCIFILLVVVVLLSSVNGAYGQSSFATITGRALDPKGASVPGANVTATNTATGIARTTTTTSDGLYRFENLQPGVYDVAIETPSFTKAEAKNVKLQVGEQRDINFNLELAGQKQSVVVTSEIPLIETTKTDTSTVIDDKSVADLPTTTSFGGLSGAANDYQGLAASAPGVRYDYTGNSSDLIGPGSVNDRGIKVNIDGGNISDGSTSGRDALGASVEEVKEFQVLQNNFNAEYGQATNLILNVITKSGTNQVHGDFHAYFRGRNLGASDWFYNQGFAGATLPDTHGCPLSDFSGGAITKIDGCGRAAFFKHEYGFTVGGPFIKDRLFWFGSFEKVAQGVPTTTTPFGNSITVTSPTNEIMGSAKVDAKLTDKHTLTVRYNLQRDLSDNLIVQTGGNTAPSGFVSQVAHDNTLNVGMVSTPTSHTVNEARFFWHRTLTATPTKSIQPGQALPNAYVGADFCCPQAGLNHRFEYTDNVSWTHGSHTIKVGGLISHYPFDSLFTQFRFGRYEGFGPGTCVNKPFGLCPTSFTVGIGPAFVHVADTAYGAFVQDTWQFRRNITVNYGIRYDIESGAFDGGTITQTQNPSAPKGGCLQQNGIIPACGKDHNNWQPRLGIAWSPNFEHGLMHMLFGDPGKSVVRLAGAEMTELAYLNVVLDSRNFDGVNLFTTSVSSSTLGSDGSPIGQTILNQVYPNEPSATQLALLHPIGRFGRIRPISPTIKNPEIRQASMSITRQYGPAWVFSVGYQGVFGNGLFGETDTNFPLPVADPAHPGFFYLPARPNSAFAAIRTNFSNRTSSYNGLVVSAQKRASHHFQFQGNYVFSKTLGTGEDFFGLSEPGNPVANLKLDKAPVQNDIRHLGNMSFVMDTENLFGTPIIKQALNNWTFAMINTLQSGRPYPVSTGGGGFAGSAFPALNSETNQRPNVLANGNLVATNIATYTGTNLTVGQSGVAACQAAGLANCAALQTSFDAPAGASGSGPADSFSGNPVDFQFLNGDVARNAGIGPPLYRFDISLTKAFKVTESMRLEFKMDVFNVFNHPLFTQNNGNDNLSVLSLPSLTVPVNPANPNGPQKANPGFNCTASCINPFTGLYLGANGAALTLHDFQVGRLDKDFANTNFAGLGNPSAGSATGGTVTPRIIQLAVRFRW
jgi:hypothetical protein